MERAARVGFGLFGGGEAQGMATSHPRRSATLSWRKGSLEAHRFGRPDHGRVPPGSWAGRFYRSTNQTGILADSAMGGPLDGPETINQ